MSKGTQNVLDRMTTAIVERKSAARPALTPVGFEAGAPEPHPPFTLDAKHPLMFPFDSPETAQSAIRLGLNLVASLSEEVEHVGRSLVALAGLYGVSDEQPAPAPPIVAEQAREAAADAKHAAFEQMMTEKSDAARAAFFPPPDAPGEWQCPDHGVAKTVARVGKRTGRTYRACEAPGCGAFEKGVSG